MKFKNFITEKKFTGYENDIKGYKEQDGKRCGTCEYWGYRPSICNHPKNNPSKAEDGLEVSSEGICPLYRPE